MRSHWANNRDVVSFSVRGIVDIVSYIAHGTTPIANLDRRRYTAKALRV